MQSEQIGTYPEMKNFREIGEAGGKQKGPAPTGEWERGKLGNIDGPYLTRPALDIQAQFPVFKAIATSLPGECREVER